MSAVAVMACLENPFEVSGLPTWGLDNKEPTGDKHDGDDDDVPGRTDLRGSDKVKSEERALVAPEKLEAAAGSNPMNKLLRVFLPTKPSPSGRASDLYVQLSSRQSLMTWLSGKHELAFYKRKYGTAVLANTLVKIIEHGDAAARKRAHRLLMVLLRGWWKRSIPALEVAKSLNLSSGELSVNPGKQRQIEVLRVYVELLSLKQREQRTVEEVLKEVSSPQWLSFMRRVVKNGDPRARNGEGTLIPPVIQLSADDVFEILGIKMIGKQIFSRTQELQILEQCVLLYPTIDILSYLIKLCGGEATLAQLAYEAQAKNKNSKAAKYLDLLLDRWKERGVDPVNPFKDRVLAKGHVPKATADLISARYRKLHPSD
uniref:RxLR effector candidate protein n=1 Tax=Peronospora matthiolae TaxID=2874970 RepID=A0AAV1TS82_9STRA